MALLPDQIDDFVTNTLNRYLSQDRKQWVDISTTYQHYEFASRMFRQKGKRPERGGTLLQWQVQVSMYSNTKNSAMYAVSTSQQKDLTTTAKQEWSKQESSFPYDIDEPEFQSGPETIIDLVGVRRHAMYVDYFQFMEEAMWSAPTSSTQDPRPASGIPFWIQKASASPGFNGGDPSGFSSGAGQIATGTYPNWKNYTFNYTDVTRADLVEKMRVACEKTRFKTPHNFNQLDPEQYTNCVLYTALDIKNALERFAESRNDNLGTDLAKYMGAVTLKGCPVVWNPHMDDNDSSDPIYGVNWDVIKYYYQKNRNEKVLKPMPAAHQPTVREVFMINWGNFMATNRRRLWVGSKA